MTPEHRRVIAAIAACVHRGRAFGWVYDHDLRLEAQISVVGAGGKVGAYVHLGQGKFDGVIGEVITDRATGQTLAVERTEKGLYGLDASGEARFEATVEGERVLIYDWADGKHHDYSVR